VYVKLCKRVFMAEVETSLQRFGEFLLRVRLVRERAAPQCVRWVRRFLMRQASEEPPLNPGNSR
jgi:hypothetical protein